MTYFIRTVAVFAICLMNSRAFIIGNTAPPAVFEPFSVQSSPKVPDGACVCQIKIPDTLHCSSATDKETVREELAEISSRLEHHAAVVEDQAAVIASLTQNMTSALEKLERIEEGDLVVTRPEFDGFRREIAHMETLLLLLKNNSTVSSEIVSTLEAEVLNMTSSLRRLEGEQETDLIQLEAEVANLKRKLVECQQDDEDERNAVFFSYDWDKPGYADSCKQLRNVSAPFTMRSRGSTATRGTWFRDPVRDQSKIYLLPLAGSGRYDQFTSSQVEEYASMNAFRLGLRARTIQITERSQGTGMVAYNGSLYYQVQSSRNIARYNIDDGHQIKRSLPSDTKISNTGSYMSESFSDIDFEVDESGLWVIYSTTSGNGVIMISKLDPETLLRTETWTTSVTKSSQGNCFMMCEVLHCTNSYNTHVDKINYYFNTKTSVESFVYVPIDSKFLGTYALSYNPYDQKLYGYDNGHQVVYQLWFEE